MNGWFLDNKTNISTLLKGKIPNNCILSEF